MIETTIWKFKTKFNVVSTESRRYTIRLVTTPGQHRLVFKEVLYDPETGIIQWKNNHTSTYYPITMEEKFDNDGNRNWIHFKTTRENITMEAVGIGRM